MGTDCGEAHQLFVEGELDALTSEFNNGTLSQEDFAARKAELCEIAPICVIKLASEDGIRQCDVLQTACVSESIRSALGLHLHDEFEVRIGGQLLDAEASFSENGVQEGMQLDVKVTSDFQEFMSDMEELRKCQDMLTGGGLSYPIGVTHLRVGDKVIACTGQPFMGEHSGTAVIITRGYYEHGIGGMGAPNFWRDKWQFFYDTYDLIQPILADDEGLVLFEGERTQALLSADMSASEAVDIYRRENLWTYKQPVHDADNIARNPNIEHADTCLHAKKDAKKDVAGGSCSLS